MVIFDKTGPHAYAFYSTGCGIELGRYLGASNDDMIKQEIFTRRADAAWRLLNGRFAERLSTAELDYLYAGFVFGMTWSAYSNAEPATHLEVCRSLLELKLSTERAHDALHKVPEARAPWISAAFEAVELRGLEMGRELAENKLVNARRTSQTSAARAI